LSRSPIERDLLISAVNAACLASQDSGVNGYSAKESGPLNEQWVHSYVGFAINDELRCRYKDAERSNFVTFETSVAWLEEFGAGVKIVGKRPAALTKRKRFDLTIWTKGADIGGVIEIKDQPAMARSVELGDPTKLCKALDRWETTLGCIFI
jgi:hypothetical protein